MQNKKLLQILAVIFAAVFLGCVAWLAIYFVQLSKANEQLEDLKNDYVEEAVASSETLQAEKQTETNAGVDSVEQIHASTQVNTESQETIGEQVSESKYPGLEGYDVPKKDIDFAALQREQNEHIYAWITIPGTVIDYPVLQHPEEIGYYLDHNLDHSTGYPGCIYTQLYNSKEWDDPITSVYGHNMKDGSMFAALHSYRDSQFFEENPYIYIYTEDKTLVYEIFAAYEYNDMDLVLMYHYGGESTYKEYLDSIYTLDGINNNFNTEIEVTTEDKVLTLVTCISDKPDMRYLVQGVLVAEGEAQ